MKYLFDTDTCSWLVHARPGYETIVEKCAGLRHGDIGISAISFAELHFMAANSVEAERKARQVMSLLLRFQMLAFDEAAARTYGRVRVALRHTPIGDVDALIAAHALSVHAAVVTGNVKHFARVPGLAVENWIACA